MSRSGVYSTVGLQAATPAAHARVAEGHAVVMMPPAAAKPDAAAAACNRAAGDDTSEPPAIFYNKAQVVNRDLSVCVLETFSHLRAAEPRRKGGVGEDGITVLEALSATGLRALRYWHEVEGIRHIVANDLDPEAVDCIRTNSALNGAPIVSVAEFNATGWTGAPSQSERKAAAEAQAQRIKDTPRGIVPNCADAISLMQHLAIDPERYAGRTLTWLDAQGKAADLPQKQLMDVIDLDPYGTASPFLDSCVQCAKEGALLLVTCTDSAILCGNYSETCHAKYNCVSARVSACHEMAARIVLASIERAANKHGKYIEPLISLHIDFYVRVFVRIRTQASEAKLAVCKLANLFHCVNCPAYHVKPIARVRPAKNYNQDGSKTNTKMHRSERGAQAAADVAQGSDSELPDDQPISYPQTPSRSVPIHTTSMPVDDVPRRCAVCNGRIAIAGPFYAAPSQDPAFIDQVLATMSRKGADKLKAYDRVHGLLQAAKGELPHAPLFYRIPDFASLLKMHVPPTALIVAALARKGYQCSQVHCDGTGLKTTAPAHVVAAVMRAYRESVWRPAVESASVEDGAEPIVVAPVPKNIRPPPMAGCDFSYDKAFDNSSKATGVAKFIPNPAFWGPRARHVGAAE